MTSIKFWLDPILNSHNTPVPPSKFQHNPTYGLEYVFEEFQDGYHGMILAVLNLTVAQMPPTNSAQSNLAFGRKCGLKILDIGTE